MDMFWGQIRRRASRKALWIRRKEAKWGWEGAKVKSNFWKMARVYSVDACCVTKR